MAGLVAGLVLGCRVAEAQPAPGPGEDPPMMAIDAILLDEKEPPEMYFRDPEGAYETFEITWNARGGWNRMVQARELVLYREGVDEDGQPMMQPAISVPLPESDRLILVFFRDTNNRMSRLVLDDREGVHPGGTGRLVNLTDGPIAAQLNRDVHRLEPRQDQATGPLLANGERFTFGFATQGKDGFEMQSPIRAFRLPSPEMRFMAVFTYINKEVEVDEGRSETVRVPRATRLYDRAPDYGPEPEASSGPQTGARSSTAIHPRLPSGSRTRRNSPWDSSRRTVSAGGTGPSAGLLVAGASRRVASGAVTTARSRSSDQE